MEVAFHPAVTSAFTASQNRSVIDTLGLLAAKLDRVRRAG